MLNSNENDRKQLMVDFSKIKINGRYLYKGGFYYLFNGGSSLSFKMKGQGFNVSFDSCPIDAYFYIIVDRDYKNKKKYLSSKKDTNIKLDGNTHYIDIVKANESNDNVFKVLDLSIDDGEILEYDHDYSYRVKVIGDSTVAGFGILAHDGPSSIDTSDSVQDFVYHALYEINAYVDAFSASGWGLAFSIYTCPNRVGLIDYIDKVAVNKHDDWIDNSKYDLLVVSVGTNDNSFIQLDPSLKQERLKEYIAKYKQLLDKETSINPDIKILMVYGTLNEVGAYFVSEETYKALKPLYKNLYIHKFKGDNTAISNHAYVDAHDFMAEELKAVIKDLLG